MGTIEVKIEIPSPPTNISAHETYFLNFFLMSNCRFFFLNEIKDMMIEFTSNENLIKGATEEPKQDVVLDQNCHKL